MASWRDVISEDDHKGYSVRETALPAYDEGTVLRCSRLCEENLCGKYGTCWACPPGFSEHMDTLSERFGSALLISRFFPCDPRDPQAVDECNADMKSMVRTILGRLRGAGIGCSGLSDGGCDLCPVCAYPEACRHPDLVLPSVSAVGIDMESYLASIGERFEFRDDGVTFYGIVLIA